jgi:hypothetical protein
MRMSARRFFLLYKHIKRLRERENYDLWLMVNWVNLTNKEFKEKVFQSMIKTAFPDSEAGKNSEPYWMNPEPGLHLVAK